MHLVCMAKKHIQPAFVIRATLDGGVGRGRPAGCQPTNSRSPSNIKRTVKLVLDAVAQLPHCM